MQDCQQPNKPQKTNDSLLQLPKTNICFYFQRTVSTGEITYCKQSANKNFDSHDKILTSNKGGKTINCLQCIENYLLNTTYKGENMYNNNIYEDHRSQH